MNIKSLAGGGRNFCFKCRRPVKVGTIVCGSWFGGLGKVGQDEEGVRAEFEEILKREGLDEGLLRETAYAYADQFGEVFEDLRDLNWAGEYVGPGIFKDQAEVVSMYNEFRGLDTANAIVRYFGEDTLYRLGRESSVVVYVKSDKALPPDGSFMADEIDEEKPGEIRLWWD